MINFSTNGNGKIEYPCEKYELEPLYHATKLLQDNMKEIS
jgi:hypothetical protein